MYEKDRYKNANIVLKSLNIFQVHDATIKLHPQQMKL